MNKTATVNLKESKYRLGKACLVCGESVVFTEHELMALNSGIKIDSKICDKCRQAILYARKQMEENNHDA